MMRLVTVSAILSRALLLLEVPFESCRASGAPCQLEAGVGELEVPGAQVVNPSAGTLEPTEAEKVQCPKIRRSVRTRLCELADETSGCLSPSS
jgi:hypothetical protein